MNTQLSDLIHEALGYETDAFSTDAPVSGGDLLQWFADWRARLKAVARLERAGTARKGKRPTCSACGSENIAADAVARWNVSTHEWEVSNIFDKGHGCDDCESNEIELVWVDVRRDRRKRKEGGIT